jgi:hypothetical protein
MTKVERKARQSAVLWTQNQAMNQAQATPALSQDGTNKESMGGLSAVGSTHADPGVANLLIMNLRIVDDDVEPEPLHR